MSVEKDIDSGNEWVDRWHSGKTGFHQDDFNAFLIKQWAVLSPDTRSTVLVPLCGKSRDMNWLHQRGHRVVGVELVEMACRAFFEEQSLPYECIESGGVLRFEGREAGEGMTILCADLFSLTKDDIGPIEAWYDRAAIVALPPALWEKYASWVAAMLPSGGVGLMMTFAYPQDERDGPPFSVRVSDVDQHFGARFSVDLVDRVDLTAGNRWNLSSVHKPVIHLRRR